MEDNLEQQTDPSIEIDPWLQAFEALDKEQENDSQAVTDTDGRADGVSNDTQADSGQHSDQVSPSDGGSVSDELGGYHNDRGASSSQDGISDYSDEDGAWSAEDLKRAQDAARSRCEERAIRDVAKSFIEKGARHINGKLGANITDPDICKRDEDGMPHYYNPETGREFMGDNPRKQAQEWCDDYNKDLADSFNKTCKQYVDKLMENEKPSLDVLEFAPKYEALDPVRQRMFDAIVEDYEIIREGEVIGYSCDLNKALEAVNRQIRAIQEHGKSMSQSQAQPAGGPALDIKSSAASGGTRKAPKSLAEAMEISQQAMLDEFHSKKGNDNGRK